MRRLGCHKEDIKMGRIWGRYVIMLSILCAPCDLNADAEVFYCQWIPKRKEFHREGVACIDGHSTVSIPTHSVTCIRINAKMHFLAQTKGRREKERERKRKGKEKGKGERERRKGKEKGKGKLEVKLWQKRKKSQTPQPGSNPGPQQTRLMLYH